ncbi:MAG: endonuclease III [Fimbriimonadaceae bacterium]|nr:endonuclease III [Alphaproteobacteria bacterium]
MTKSSTSKRPPPAAKKSGAAKAKTKKPALLSDAEVAEVFRRFQAADPAPKGELNYTNPFTLLVAVVLSAQATDVGVNKATRELFKIADTPEKMLALGEDKLRDHIRTIGLFRNKAKNVIKLSQQLIADHHSTVPNDRDALESLAGVGRKTANVVLNIAFGAPTMAVDTHILRISNRIGLASGTTPLAIEKGLVARIPQTYMDHAHHWLILHGRYVCKARKPDCDICILNDICKFDGKTIPA